MPVVEISLQRFAKMVGADRKTVLERLPYIGLDIESVERDTVRVEYSPNRPDFGTDLGIARALKGILGKQVGLARYAVHDSGLVVEVDKRLSKVRPYIACATAEGLELDEEGIRQIISLQEDLHNGLGRKRKVVAIGLHDMDAIKPQLAYRAVDAAFSFVPLGSNKKAKIRQILAETPEGKSYAGALQGSTVYPIITDSSGTVLSFPPIINGNATRVTTKTRDMFVDVTSTDQKVGDEVLAILVTTLVEAGARIGSVLVRYPERRRKTPDLSDSKVPLDLKLVRSVLGMELTRNQIVAALSRSRLGVRGSSVICPRYRFDLLHPVDVAEEVELGYGPDRIVPVYPPSKQPGSFNPFEDFLDSVATVMAGSGMIELMTFELTDEKSLYENFRRDSKDKISVHDPRSSDHSILRDSLLPGLMSALSSNVKSEYPQRVFEVGRVYKRTKDGVSESWHLGSLSAHSQATYSEAKMFAGATCLTMTGKPITTKEGEHWAFALGRSASIHSLGGTLGQVGEFAPESLEAFGLRVPVSGFELDLSQLFERLK